MNLARNEGGNTYMNSGKMQNHPWTRNWCFNQIVCEQYQQLRQKPSKCGGTIALKATYEEGLDMALGLDGRGFLVIGSLNGGGGRVLEEVQNRDERLGGELSRWRSSLVMLAT
jgi:hypothetical protein